MLLPVRREGNIDIFTLDQINMFGEPYHYGYSNYLITSTRGDEMPMGYDYQDQFRTSSEDICPLPARRPIHRYNRLERFTTILAQLLGFRDTRENPQWPHIAPLDEIFELVQHCDGWNEIRGVLKETGNKKYYNMIPSLMRMMGLAPILFGRVRKVPVTNTLFHKMINDFRVFEGKYLLLPTRSKYFPSLRYIAFKIMQDNWAEFNDVVFIRTPRIERKLEAVWEEIMFEE